jgi:hypothetical protein
MVAHADVEAGAWPVQQRRHRNGGRSERGADAPDRDETTRRRDGGGSEVRLLGGGSGAAQGGEVAKMGRRLGEQVQVAW